MIHMYKVKSNEWIAFDYIFFLTAFNCQKLTQLKIYFQAQVFWNLDVL